MPQVGGPTLGYASYDVIIARGGHIVPKSFYYLSLGRTDHSSRGVLPTLCVCVCAWCVCH